MNGRWPTSMASADKLATMRAAGLTGSLGLRPAAASTILVHRFSASRSPVESIPNKATAENGHPAKSVQPGLIALAKAGQAKLR